MELSVPEAMRAASTDLGLSNTFTVLLEYLHPNLKELMAWRMIIRFLRTHVNIFRTILKIYSA